MRKLRYLAIALCAVFLTGTNAQAVDPESAPLSNTQIIMAMEDATRADAVARVATGAMLEGVISENKPVGFYVQDYPNMAALEHGLLTPNRLIALDCAAGNEDNLDKFEFVLGTSNVLRPEGLGGNLAPEEAAKRWQSVQISPNMYFEIADWQFGGQLEAAGYHVEFPDHPATHPQDAPES